MPKTQEMMERAKTERDRGERVMAISAIRACGDDKDKNGKKTYQLSFSSEEPYARFWGIEILSHAEGAADLTRLNSIGCALFNHDRNKVIGKITRAWIENGRGEAEIEFDTDDFSKMIQEKVDNGTLKGVSVGYSVSLWEDVPKGKTSSDGRFQGECSVATKWEPLEVSIVSVPADATVGVGRSMDDDSVEHATETKGVSGFLNEKQLQINLNTIRR